MSRRDLDIEKIHLAFSPSKEIQDPHLFVGRTDEIASGIAALMNRGGFLSIFGLRGVGKSSIAYQLKLIAEGKRDLPKTLNIDYLLPKKGFSYIVHYVRCDGFVKNIPDLLKRILFGDDANPALFSLTKAGDRRLAEFKRTIEAEGSFKFFGAKGGEERTYTHYISDDLIQQFRQLLGTIPKDNQGKTGLLILIDEFDTIPDKTGFASIVKACSSDFVKFGVVGIATNITELIQDHNSIGRQIDMIQVPLMPTHELAHILRRAEYLVDHEITFDTNAQVAITSKSEGFPYFTHLLGKEAMMLAFKRRTSIVGQDDIDSLASLITAGRLNTIYEDLYHRAIKGSIQREVLLKAFAETSEDEINTEPVYALAKELGVTNPSQLMKELTAVEPGPPVLTKVRDRYYRFTDPVFKVYARMRQWKF